MAKKSKRKRIEQLINELEALPFTTFPKEDLDKENFYPFSNERGLGKVIDSLNEEYPLELSPKRIRVGILIGESSICSLLPALVHHCDLIVCTDMNPYLIKHVRSQISLLSSCSSISEFEKQYFQENSSFFEDMTPCQTTPNLAMRKKTLGAYHFLHSNSQFLSCQKAMQTLRFAYCHTNLFHPNNQEAFFQCLQRRNVRITFFNATNLYEWDAVTALARVKTREGWKPEGKIKTLLNRLPSYLHLMFSLRANPDEPCPLENRLVSSVDSYFKANEQSTMKYLQAKFAADQKDAEIEPDNDAFQAPTNPPILPHFQSKGSPPSFNQLKLDHFRYKYKH